MAPQSTKRKSDDKAGSGGAAPGTAPPPVAVNTGSHADQSSPRKKHKTGISLSQKQALIDNLQLEVTERARQLRAQYNLQAQGLRTRIEIRVNRIPMALRKTTMGELADKYKHGQHPQQGRPTPSHSVSRFARPTPVPEKDTPSVGAESFASTLSHATTSARPGPGRPPKRTSQDISGDNKEKGGGATEPEAPRKKLCVAVDATKGSDVLSPSSGNGQALARPTPRGKPPSVRPAAAAENTAGRSKSPLKQGSMSNLFGSWAERARSPRKKASVAAMNMGTASAAGRKPGTTSASGTTKAAATMTLRRASGTSESSESSSSTVVKKGERKKASPAKKMGGVMGSIRRGVAGASTKRAAQKKAAQKQATVASAATGRVLRNRNI